MTQLWNRFRQWIATGPADGDDVSAAVSEACREEVLPGLLAALDSPSPVVVRGAAAAIRKLGAEALTAAPTLARVAAKPIPAGDGQTTAQHEYARAESAYALGDLLALVAALSSRHARRAAPAPEGPPPDVLDLLLVGTRDPEAAVRTQAWAGLRSYVDDPRVRHAALDGLDDPDANVRRQVLYAIGPRGLE